VADPLKVAVPLPCLTSVPPLPLTVPAKVLEFEVPKVSVFAPKLIVEPDELVKSPRVADDAVIPEMSNVVPDAMLTDPLLDKLPLPLKLTEPALIVRAPLKVLACVKLSAPEPNLVKPPDPEMAPDIVVVPLEILKVPLPFKTTEGAMVNVAEEAITPPLLAIVIVPVPI
jgi:hypothetical protein